MMASSKLKTAAEVSRELMDSALYAVKKSGVSKKLAAKLFGVSRTTLGRRLQNPRPERHGGRTKFPAQVEDELVDLLTSCCIMGIPLNRYHCYQLFSQVAIELGLKNTACSSTSFKNFLKRHKSLSLRISHASNRKQDREWTMEVCEQYISKLQKLKDGGFLDAPEQIWNLDETAFHTSQVVDTVVGVKGLKLVPSQFNGNAKECVTVLPCGNAAGLQLKFLALYSGKLHIQSRLQDTHNMCYHAVNVSGYMDQLIFANYVKTVVFPAMTAEKNVIFVDGHFSHVNNLLLVRYCRDHFKETGVEVQIFCFPSGQTSRLQPFDVSAFGPMKKKWNEHLRNRRIKKGIVR
ncbi:hypothetical protein RvY_19347 [Ramazzottius varieornatus]|uniref:DDE-1 domain-containing protein n=1 Tax=Ramazzottius varieornatus TaxID=947166 RepID=A0A1D1W951_RAMVA|nr:hypothetical protein RvY_19347 [Ramazzottius varieornatus]